MRKLWDAQRSIGFYAWQALGEDWSISFQREDKIFRPHAVVRAIGPTVLAPSGARTMDYMQPFSVHLYPEVQSEKEYELTQARAAELGDQFLSILTEGFAPEGWPHRIPLRDYDGIGLDEESPEEFDGYIRTDNETVTWGPDPEDDKYMMIVVTFRGQWRKANGQMPNAMETINRTPTPYPIVDSVSGRFATPVS